MTQYRFLQFFVAFEFALISSPFIFAGELNFEAATLSVAENAGTFTVNVKRTGDASATATVKITSSDGTALSPDNYGAVTETLNWAAGNSDLKPVEITITDNATLNNAKEFTLTLSEVTGDTLGTTSSTIVKITDYEEGSIQIDDDSVSAAENSLKAIVKLIRFGGVNGAVTAKITFADETAVKGSDYFGPDSTVTFKNGQSELDFQIALRNDNNGEANETFTLTLSEPGGGASLGTKVTARIQITDSDTDFSSTARKISESIPNVAQTTVLDLNQTSVLDPAATYIELINQIPLMRDAKIIVTQDGTSGLLKVPFGSQSFYFRPTSITRDTKYIVPGVALKGAGNAVFTTQAGHVITAVPALAAVTAFQQEITSFSIPEMTITEHGNVSIQANQGVPEIIKKVNGELVIANSFYDRWNLRPQPLVQPSNYNGTGLYMAGHPTVLTEQVVDFYFWDGSKYMVQSLITAPVSDAELELAMQQTVGVVSTSLRETGEIELVKTGMGTTTVKYTLFPDYKISRVPNYISSMQGFSETADVNGDGESDYKMTYSNGYEQFFFVKNIE